MKTAILLAIMASLVVAPGTVLAAPWKAENNPGVVANYQTPENRGIVDLKEGDPSPHTGADLVKLNGNSGNFHQWFEGTSAAEGNHGEHSNWKKTEDGTCPSDWVLIEDASSKGWGDYLEAGADYCVKTNSYLLGNEPARF